MHSFAVHGKCPAAHYPDKKNRGKTIIFKNHLKQTTMEKFKMSLANVPGKLSRAEMKTILAGSQPKDTGEFCNGRCEYLGSLSPTDWREGTCVYTTIPMQVGCACKKQDGTLITGCN
jgi:hypothetical protein